VAVGSTDMQVHSPPCGPHLTDLHTPTQTTSYAAIQVEVTLGVVKAAPESWKDLEEE
jgi:hypothetical protein